MSEKYSHRNAARKLQLIIESEFNRGELAEDLARLVTGAVTLARRAVGTPALRPIGAANPVTKHQPLPLRN